MPTLMLRESLISYDGTARHYTVPSYIRNIADRAFFDTATLQRLTLPGRMDRIGDEAFRSCFNMKRIDLPAEAETVGSDLFRDCRSLTEVSLPAGTVSIGCGMFQNCISLRSLAIPDTVGSIEPGGLSGCEGLRELYISPERLELLPVKYLSTALITYMENHTSDGGSRRVDGFAEKIGLPIAEQAVEENRRNAVLYLFDHSLIQAADIPRLLERADRSGNTEIAAILLENSQPEEGEAMLDWDPFADL